MLGRHVGKDWFTRSWSDDEWKDRQAQTVHEAGANEAVDQRHAPQDDLLRLIKLGVDPRVRLRASPSSPGRKAVEADELVGEKLTHWSFPSVVA